MPGRIKTSVASGVHAAPAAPNDGIATKFVVRLDTADPVSMIKRRSWPTALGHDPAKEACEDQRRAQEKPPHNRRKPPGANRRSRF
jgi:hypothetical protein